jgi:hypothetical protein
MLLKTTVEVTVPVPDQLRDFMVLRRSAQLVIGAFLWPAILFAMMVHSAPRLGRLDGGMLVIVLPFMAWYLVQLQKKSIATMKDDCNYKLSHNAYYAQDKLALLSLRGHGWFWSWQTVTFPLDSVAHVRQEQWRGLPALRITLNKPSRTALAGPLFLIYAEEDGETVNGSIMPLLNRFRTA